MTRQSHEMDFDDHLALERYARAMEAADEGHWEWNILTDEMFLSVRMKEMLGFAPDAQFASRADLLARQPILAEDRQRLTDMREQTLSGAAARYEIEYRIFPRPGELRWVRSRGKVFRDEHGRPLRIAGSLTDITDRKLADEALRRSEQRFALAVAGSNDGIWDWDVLTDEMFFSERTQSLYGLEPGVTTRKRAEWRQMISLHPDDAVTQLAAIEDYLTGGAPAYDGEWRVRHPDGRYRWVRIRGLGVRDESGRVTRLAGSVSDIDAKKCAEDALRLSEHRYALAMEATGDGHWDWNIPVDRIYVSPLLLDMCGLPADITFASRSEWVDRFPFFPGERPRYEQAVAEHFAGRTARLDVEIRIVPRGETRWIHMTGRCSRDSSGKPIRWAGAVTDVTERKRIEHQLRQAQRLEAVGTLAGGIAHDFNNLLGAILGYGEMALRNAPAGTRLRRDLDSIMIAGERGRALVDRILAFSRSGIGERVAVHVEAVVRETLELFAASLPDGIVIEDSLRSGRAAVLGDATQIHQVLMNLVTNAMQAMPSGGTLRVSLERATLDGPRAATTGPVAAKDYVVLKVADTGSGMAPETLERIFDPFFTTKEVGVGTGLGLSLVHGIVTGLGGAIDVATSAGKGSVFTVYLPRTGDVGNASKPRKRAQPSKRRGDRQRILIVDDEESLVRLTTQTLTDLGYEPVGFTASAAALAALRADPQRFDAVITDESMPGTAGSELIRKMRGIRPTIPIVLVSGYLSAAVVQRAREAGADDVLKKPLSARELATSLERVLHARKAHGASAVEAPTAKRRQCTGASASRAAKQRR